MSKRPCIFAGQELYLPSLWQQEPSRRQRPLLLKLRTVLYRKRKFRRPTPRGMTFPWEQKQKRQQLRKQQNIQRQQHLKQIRLFLRHWNQKKQNPAQAKQSLRKRLRIRTEPGKLFPLRMMRNFWRRLLRRRFLLIS